jgi:hypothetical protein
MQPPATLLSRFLTRQESEVDLKQLSPAWAPPGHCNDIIIYVPKKNGHERIRGHFDKTQNTFRRTNGAALPIILGWTE